MSRLGLPNKLPRLQGKYVLSDLFPEVYTTLGIQYYRIVLPTIFAPEARKKLYDFCRESNLLFMETYVRYCLVRLERLRRFPFTIPLVSLTPLTNSHLFPHFRLKSELKLAVQPLQTTL